MVTFHGRHGYDGKAMLIDGFEVVLGGQVVGFIWPGGSFNKVTPEGCRVECPDAVFTEEEKAAIDAKCAKVRQVPSEYGWIGVGESMDPHELKLVIDQGRGYEEVMPGVQLHRRDLENTHDYNI